MNRAEALQQLKALHRRMDACTRCPKMIRPVIHGPPVLSRIYTIGQAPGPHEAKFGYPFAWTAGKTLFRWFETLGVDEQTFRQKVYMAATARCFPGKERGGGDRKPDPLEILACRPFIEGEVAILQPKLVVPIGLVGIEQVLGRKTALAEVIGVPLRADWHQGKVDVICLPHPSGASTWHRMEPGISLLSKALRLLGANREWQRTFAVKSR